MSTKKEGIRPLINKDYAEKLERLSNILGHASISRTIEYVLERHLEAELEAAEAYQKLRDKL